MTGRAEFSVVEFGDDDKHAYIERAMKGRDAVELAAKCCRRSAHPDSGVHRVIITDGGDNTVFEWKRGVGITFPLNWTGGIK